MIVRIRFGAGPKVGKQGRKNRRMALATAALLTPLAVMASALGFWRIAADLGLTANFAIPSGLFSHWHIWLGAAALLQFCSRALSRYGRAEGAPAPLTSAMSPKARRL
jgi:hypothetical protein